MFDRPIAPVLAALAVAGLAVSALADPLTLPASFRSWTHVKSVVAYDQTDAFYGFRNVYANDAAIGPLRHGGPYPDGAALVMSFHEPVAKDGHYVEGKAMKYVVMVRSAAAKKTDGWRYEAFAAGDPTPLVGDAAYEKCHACHVAGAKDRGFVFSRYVD